jgi:phosphate transport system protein
MHENRHILEKKKSELQQHILMMAEMASQAIVKAVSCVEEVDLRCAEEVIRSDKAINHQHSHTESTAVSILASQQPVARDLREVVAAMRISDEIERIADHAANIAGIRLKIDGANVGRVGQIQVREVSDRVVELFEFAMGAYRDTDIEKARATASREEEVDVLAKSFPQQMFKVMKEDPNLVEDGSRMMWINHNLERIADRATNIAEQVIYIVTAQEEDLN